MRRLLLLACRAFPPEHRARESDEVVDTAVLAANGSTWRTFREALSLVTAGLRQRLRVERHRSLREGVVLFAGLLALVNLAVALAGLALGVHPPPPFECPCGPRFDAAPWVIDWWWIAFAVAAAGIVLGLVLGIRLLAFAAALANLGIVTYDAISLAPVGREHLNTIAYMQGGFPAGQEWLGPAAVLVLVTATAPMRRLKLRRLTLALVAASLLVVLSRELRGGFFFLRWPFGAIVVLALAFGWVAPRLAVVALGISAALAAIAVDYLTTPYYHDPVVTWVVAPGLALGILLPLAYLTRRRLA
jgi:hypothetical protein